MDPGVPSQPQSGHVSPGSARLQLVAVALVQFAVTVDFFGLNVALPEVASDLSADTADLQWIVNAYMLALTTVLVGAGRIADLFGRRRLMLVGIVLFAAGSLASGVAHSPGVFIGGRACAGLGAAFITATGLSIVANAFSEERRPQAIGVWTSIGALGSAVGPLLGGVLTQSASWRWIFLINAPVAALTTILVVSFVRESRDEEASGRVDLAGLLTLTASLGLAVFALLQAAALGWSSLTIILPLGGGVLLFAVFLAIESRTAEPLVRLELFTGRRYVGAATVAFAANFAFAATMLYLTLYLQHVRGLSPIVTGAVFLIFTVTYISASPGAGWATSRVGVTPLMGVGMIVLALGAGAFATLDISETPVWLVAGLVMSGIGQGLAFNTSNVAGVAAVPGGLVGAGAGVISGIRQFGSLTGLAVTAAVFSAVELTDLINKLEPFVGDRADDVAAELSNTLTASDEAGDALADLVPGLGARADDLVDTAFLSAMAAVMLVVVGVCVAGVVGAWLTRGVDTNREA